MHLAEDMLPLSQAVAWSALASPAVVWSLRHCPHLVRRSACVDER